MAIDTNTHGLIVKKASDGAGALARTRLARTRADQCG